MGVLGLTVLARAAAKETRPLEQAEPAEGVPIYYRISNPERTVRAAVAPEKGNAAEKKGRLTALLELLCLSRMRRAAGNRLLCGQPELSVNCFPPNWLDRCSDTKKQEKECGEVRQSLFEPNFKVAF